MISTGVARFYDILRLYLSRPTKEVTARKQPGESFFMPRRSPEAGARTDNTEMSKAWRPCEITPLSM